MAVVYSTLFIAQNGFTGTTAIGPPSNQIWILRDLDAYANISLLGGATLALRGSLGQTIWFKDWGSGEQDSVFWRGRQVIPSDLTFEITQTGDPVDVTVSGYVLTAP